ncbi:MAG TPA: hypothetical protein VFH39_03320 [Candidatus Saccharimonadales bacterium]|jgi:hypothetical protein|nr:hypothetical protein [Candidatus Saccharimonadales bacterium]
MLTSLGEQERIAKLRRLSATERQSVEEAYDKFIAEGSQSLNRFLSTMACGKLLELESDLSQLALEAKENKESLDPDQQAILDSLAMVIMSRAIIDEVHLAPLPVWERPFEQEHLTAA